jgi:hypothetical protein
MSLDGYVSGPTDEGEIFAAIDDFTDSERYNMALLEHVDVALLHQPDAFVAPGTPRR